MVTHFYAFLPSFSLALPFLLSSSSSNRVRLPGFKRPVHYANRTIKYGLIARTYAARSCRSRMRISERLEGTLSFTKDNQSQLSMATMTPTRRRSSFACLAEVRMRLTRLLSPRLSFARFLLVVRKIRSDTQISENEFLCISYFRRRLPITC